MFISCPSSVTASTTCSCWHNIDHMTPSTNECLVQRILSSDVSRGSLDNYPHAGSAGRVRTQSLQCWRLLIGSATNTYFWVCRPISELSTADEEARQQGHAVGNISTLVEIHPQSPYHISLRDSLIKLMKITEFSISLLIQEIKWLSHVKLHRSPLEIWKLVHWCMGVFSQDQSVMIEYNFKHF